MNKMLLRNYKMNNYGYLSNVVNTMNIIFVKKESLYSLIKLFIISKIN